MRFFYKVVFGISVSLIATQAASAGEAAKDVFNGLVAAGLPVQKSGGAEKKEVISARAVFCSIDFTRAQEAQYDCEMKQLTGEGNFRVTGARAQLLVLALVSMPINQGDSGAETDFISCTKTISSAGQAYYCSVAIPISDE